MTLLRALSAIVFCLCVPLPAAARDCRAGDTPPGVRVALPPGCPAPRGQSAEAKEALAVQDGRRRGVIVLENGTEIRVGGRVRAEALGGR